MRYDPRFVYYVPGPVRREVRAALDDRHGVSGWYPPWEQDVFGPGRVLGVFGIPFEPSYVFRPADPIGVLPKIAYTKV